MAYRFLCLLPLLLFLQKTNAQSVLDKKVTVEIEASMVKAMEVLGKTAGVELAFSERFFDKNKKVKLTATNEPLGHVLQKLMEGENVGFKEIDGQVVFFKKAEKKLRKFTLNGFVEDAATGERLIAAAVFCPSLGVGTVTNEYGFYSLTLPENVDEIAASYLGYQEQGQPIVLDKNLTLHFKMEAALTLMEIVVTPGLDTAQLLPSPANEHRLLPADFQAAPDLGGESDLLRIAQMLPGVQSGADGFGGIHVRGGNADQNLVLLDGVPVYNPDHLLGIFSIFNTDVVKSTAFFRGNMPARYGGRLSSVLDVRTREGNSQQWRGGAALGLISGKGFLEGPFAKNRGSLLLSGRLTHSDILLADLARKAFFGQHQEIEKNDYRFYDLNAKLTYRFSDQDRLYLSYYQGDDFYDGKTEDYFFREVGNRSIEFEQENRARLKWGNIITSLRWNHVFNPRLFANTTLTYSQYQFAGRQLEKLSPEEEEEEEEELEAFFYQRSVSDITDIAWRTDFDFAQSYQNHLRFGGGMTAHRFIPQLLDYNEGADLGIEDIDLLEFDDFEGLGEAAEIHAIETEAYVEDEFKLGAKWHFNSGLRASAFFVGERSFFNLEPRLMASYLLSSKSNLNASFTRTVQYLHRPVQNEINLPQDVWLPSDADHPPQTAWQTTLGWTHKLAPSIQLSIEGYYKTMDHIYVPTPENRQHLKGEGLSYGMEVFLKKQKGKWGGWLGYTLSKTEREFEGDQVPSTYFNARFDRRHDFKGYLYHHLNDRWSISLNGTYGSPMPRLFAAAITGTDAENTPAYHTRSAVRSTPYHRLDAALSYFLKKEKTEHRLKVSLYNVYNRENPAFYRGYYNPQAVNLLPFMPGVNYGVKF